MAEKKLLLLGGGGHCKSVLECVLSAGVYEKIGIVENDKYKSALGISVVGNDNDLPRLLQEGWTHAFVTVGSIGSTRLRRKLYSLIKEIGFIVPTVIDPFALVARGTTIKEGTFVGKRAVINAESTIGCCAIINTGSIVEHDCIIGDFSHVSPGATLCGQVFVGSDSHIGAGSVIRQGVKIGNGSFVGMGSVVVKNISDSAKVYGNPCRVVE